MRTVSRFPREIREIENTWIELKDGCRLAARLWLPVDAETDPVPAILEYLPYRKRDGTAVRDALTHAYFAGHGYACLRVDMRGNGESDGLMEDEYHLQEQEDALEVIAWAAAQPWCSDAVGMIGISWGGFNGLQVAARQPPALKAIITLCSTDDRYSDDIHYKGGCLLNENLGWSGTMLAYSSRPPDPALVGDRWRQLWLARLEHEPLLAAIWLRHQHRDGYWKHGSVCEDFSSIKAAVFAVGGWGDAYSNAVPRLLTGLKAPRLGLTGPWVHKYPHFAVPEPAIGFLQESLRWWDHWLKGADSGIMAEPLYRAYLMDGVPPQTSYAERPGRWIAEESWPSPNIASKQFHLTPGGLSDAPDEAEVYLVASPETTGAAGGEFCAIWLGPEASGDQRSDDAGSLTFDTPPLEEPLEIFGAPVVVLELSSDRPQANLAVRLCDVSPEGASTRVSYGILNLCHRDSHETPSALEPGRRYKIRLQLDDIAFGFPAGHRLRVAVSNAYWPMIWPSPEPSRLTVFASGSSFDLPVRPPRNEAPPSFETPEGAPSLERREVRSPSNSRVTEQDAGSGAVTMRLLDDFGEYENLEHGLITGSLARETYRILPDDPLSASAEAHWTETLRRGDWDIRTETYSAMKSDRENFYLSGRLEAYEGGRLVFEKDYDEIIARDLV